MDSEDGRSRLLIRVGGIVQGVGFRPHVVRLARSLDLAGLVVNDAAGVLVDVEGLDARLETFVDRLAEEAPSGALIERIEMERAAALGRTGFGVAKNGSAGDVAATGGVARVPPDMATCGECLADMSDPGDRRFRYPFVSCSFCGPRFTIVTSMPYDRGSTTMDRFPMCAACRTEYEDPQDRRFHAQSICCANCGPALTYRSLDDPAAPIRGSGALERTVDAISDGAIVAVKGIGGYHLVCDALQPRVVERLRRSKGRGDKPFAVMVGDLGAAAQLASLDRHMVSLLRSSHAPIVLARPNGAVGTEVASAVAPGAGKLGLVLAYSPLHHLLFAPLPNRPDEPLVHGKVLVFTSGNVSDEPICLEPDEAEQRLCGVADVFLHHDRIIYSRCDDSVVRVHERVDREAQAQVVRRSRGLVPLPIALPVHSQPVLAVGGELKVAACLAQGYDAWLTQHIGDLTAAATEPSLERAVEVLGRLSGIEPITLVAVRHPGYRSRQWAVREAVRARIELRLVQHHHAHLASLLAEHQYESDVPVLGCVFDGTGYGDDGTAWGGELLVGSYRQVQRAGHLKAVLLPGGDGATRRPARSALAHLWAAGIDWESDLAPVMACDDQERRVVSQMLQSGTGCYTTTSMGRLFDAIASLAGVCQDATYEAQGPIELEALGEGGDLGWRMSLRTTPGALVLDPDPVLRSAVTALRGGVGPGALGVAFCHAVAAAVADVAKLTRRSSGTEAVGLTGGVFANEVLTDACAQHLHEEGFAVLMHGSIPPNDGGLALGQVAVVAAGGGEVLCA